MYHLLYHFGIEIHKNTWIFIEIVIFEPFKQFSNHRELWGFIDFYGDIEAWASFNDTKLHVYSFSFILHILRHNSRPYYIMLSDFYQYLFHLFFIFSFTRISSPPHEGEIFIVCNEYFKRCQKGVCAHSLGKPQGMCQLVSFIRAVLSSA